MPKLVLMRHAKSSWGTPGLADIDRPLSPRGHRAMPRVMHALVQGGIFPDHIICSTALRTRQTLALALASWTADMRIDMTRDVYEADANGLLELARAATSDDAPHTLAIIGHNTAMEDLAIALAGPNSDNAALERIKMKYPTAAVAIFDGEWSSLKAGGMRLERFIVPRELPEV